MKQGFFPTLIVGCPTPRTYLGSNIWQKRAQTVDTGSSKFNPTRNYRKIDNLMNPRIGRFLKIKKSSGNLCGRKEFTFLRTFWVCRKKIHISELWFVPGFTDLPTWQGLAPTLAWLTTSHCLNLNSCLEKGWWLMTQHRKTTVEHAVQTSWASVFKNPVNEMYIWNISGMKPQCQYVALHWTNLQSICASSVGASQCFFAVVLSKAFNRKLHVLLKCVSLWYRIET